MRIHFRVDALPPKKDGANSMWRKGSELPRLKALRVAASQAMIGVSVPVKDVQLKLTFHTDPKAGDLDSFIAGICDGLMAAQASIPIDASAWFDLPVDARPAKAIAFGDDAIISKIDAERIVAKATRYWYEVAISGE
jgi:hypothetical protein